MMEEVGADQILCSTSTVYYWKKPSLSTPHWTQCRWRLLSNGQLLWDTYRSKGILNIHDSFHRIRIDSIDPKTFFNGVPHGVQMCPFLVVLPLTKPGDARPRERSFALANFDQLKYWIRKVVGILKADDVWRLMLRRAAKELNSAGGEDKVVLEAWRQFVESLRKLDNRIEESEEDDFDLGGLVARNSNLLWAMTNATSSLQMSML